MSREVSKTVSDKIKELYAVLATAAAQKAVDAIGFDHAAEAYRWADNAADLLVRAGAHAAEWTYSRPRIKS